MTVPFACGKCPHTQCITGTTYFLETLLTLRLITPAAKPNKMLNIVALVTSVAPVISPKKHPVDTSVMLEIA